MHPIEAYEAVCRAINADPRRRIVDSRYDEQNFGSFAVSFEEGSEARCVVNDRGYLFVARGLDGTGEAIVTVPSLREENVKSLLQTLSL